MKHLSYSNRFTLTRFRIDSHSIRFSFSFAALSLNWFVQRFAVNSRVLIVTILCRDWAHLLGLIANGSIRRWVGIIEREREKASLQPSLITYETQLCKQSMQQILIYIYIYIYLYCVQYICVCVYIYSWSAACSGGTKSVRHCSCFKRMQYHL